MRIRGLLSQVDRWRSSGEQGKPTDPEDGLERGSVLGPVAPASKLWGCPGHMPSHRLPCPFLTGHLGQLEEGSLKARVAPFGVGDERDKQNVLGGEEGQVVGGRIGATQPVGAEGR